MKIIKCPYARFRRYFCSPSMVNVFSNASYAIMVDGFISLTGLGSRNKKCLCAVRNQSISAQRDKTKDCFIFTVNNTTDHVDSCPCPDLHYCSIRERCLMFVRYFAPATCVFGPPLWSSGQSFWLQIQRSRVRSPALPDFLSSSGSGTESTQPREVN